MASTKKELPYHDVVAEFDGPNGKKVSANYRVKAKSAGDAKDNVWKHCSSKMGYKGVSVRLKEETLDEISQKTLRSYINKADMDIENSIDNPNSKNASKMTKRDKGISLARYRINHKKIPMGPNNFARKVQQSYDAAKAKLTKEAADPGNVRVVNKKIKATNIALNNARKKLVNTKPTLDVGTDSIKEESINENTYTLHAVHDELGSKKKIGTFHTKTAASRHLNNSSESEWPEGHDAILTHNKTKKKWVTYDGDTWQDYRE